MNRLLLTGALALAALSFLVPGALPAGLGWDIVGPIRSWIAPEPERPPRAAAWGESYVPNVPVVTQDGETLRFYDDLVRDKVVVLSFIYTECPDICPLTTARMAQVQERLGDAVGRDIFLISLSVDPENDTPEVLKEYSEAFGRGPGWQFVTGRPEDIQLIRHRLGDRRKALSEHTQEVRLANGATGEWQRAALLGDLEVLLESIRQMDPKWRNAQRVIPFNPASNTGYRYEEHPGRDTFRRFCAPCHTVGVGDRVGPDLRGVSERREHEWLTRFIMDPLAMRRQGDPIALALSGRYPGVLMPRLGVGELDAAELIAYIDEESARLTQMEAEHRAGHDHSGHDHGHSSHEHGHGSHAHDDDNHGNAEESDRAGYRGHSHDNGDHEHRHADSQ